MRVLRPTLDQLTQLGLERPGPERRWLGWAFHRRWFHSRWEFEVSRNENGPTVSWLIAFGGVALHRLTPRALPEDEWTNMIAQEERGRRRYEARREADAMIAEVIVKLSEDESAGLTDGMREHLLTVLRASSVRPRPG